MELAGGGGAIGSCSCSGRRSRGHPIPCSCTARPCTQGGGETKVQRETLSKIIQAGSVTRDRIFITARHRLLIDSPPFPFFFLVLPRPSNLVSFGLKKKNGSRLFKESRPSKVKTSVSFVGWWSILCLIESWRVIIRSGRTGGVEARLTDLERCVILWNYCERDEAIDLSWHWDSFCIYFSIWSDMRFNRDTFFRLTKLWVSEWEIAFFFSILQRILLQNY